MEEIWKPLIYGDLDLSNRFEISSLGNLRNIKNKLLLKQQINDRGYKEVCISLGKRGRCKCLKIHRCVAFMFVTGYQKGLVVNHMDGNKCNNVFSNLEWVTNKQNTQHAIKNGLSHRNKPVICVETGEIFNSIKEASIWCGLKGKSIADYLKNPDRRKTAGKHPITKEPLTWILVNK